MAELEKYKKLKKIANTMFGIFFWIFIAGIIALIWFGTIGLKIMATSLVLMFVFYLFFKVANERIIKITKEKSNETD